MAGDLIQAGHDVTTFEALHKAAAALSSRDRGEYSHPVVVGEQERLFLHNRVHDGDKRPGPKLQQFVQPLYSDARGRIQEEFLLSGAGQRWIQAGQPRE